MSCLVRTPRTCSRIRELLSAFGFFSQSHEYPVPVVQRTALQLFLACVAFTAFNVTVLQRHFTGQESAEVGGSTVAAVCVSQKAGAAGFSQVAPRVLSIPPRQDAHMEGWNLVVWCELMGLRKVLPRRGFRMDLVVELWSSRGDPAAHSTTSVSCEGSARTRPFTGATLRSVSEWSDSIFLPVKYSGRKFLSFSLYESDCGVPRVLGHSSLPMSDCYQQVGQVFREQRLKFVGSTVENPVGGYVLSSAELSVRFRCLSFAEYLEFRMKLEEKIGQHRMHVIGLKNELLGTGHPNAANDGS